MTKRELFDRRLEQRHNELLALLEQAKIELMYVRFKLGESRFANET